jgi:hypothetical protein
MPPDIQEQLDKQRARASVPSPAGIGSAAPENVRRSARPAEPSDEVAASPPSAPAEDLSCKSTFCSAIVPADASYCSKCGFDQLRGGLTKKLGIDPFTEEDVQDYVFRGYVVRDLKVIGKHSVTVRSSQARDLKEIDAFIMNGDWTKTADGKEKSVSEFFLRQMNAISLTAMAIQKVDGQSIGATLVDRVKWLEERGSAFVDLLAQKVSLFNQALTEHLRKEDSLSGS